jgi:hypothetical protein
MPHFPLASMPAPAALAAALAAFCAPALAQDKACLLEGSFTFGGQTTEIKDCLQNGGVPAAQFKETCSSLPQATAAMGGPAAKVTWLAACPPQPQGSCEGFFGQPMTSFYYKRDAKTLADSRSSCQAQGGKWR